jgi:acyl-CoA synthetase (AMP-forming)/AMP-acid ligase II/thioesterase domain-containing protein/NAD(P)-dependent dehydrogenase (short-subunit alcohol dehydrogenase family)/acyl carrier protein
MDFCILGHKGVEKLNTCIIDKQIVEAALLNHPLIDDCVVLVREGETSRPELVAYVVSAGSLSLEQLQSHLRSCVPAAMMPQYLCLVSTLPLTKQGLVDEQALVNLPVIDSDLVQRWEERSQSVSEVEQVAVIVEEYHEKLPPLHLLDILPDQVPIGTRENVHSEKLLVESLSASSVDTAAVLQEEPSKALAISYGEQLRLEADTPTTLSAALRRTTLQAPSKGIIYLQHDGSEIVQSYEALLQEAERILAGLRQLGLKPQDKVIFQIDQNWDFIPAFWGCILGGFVPVPISTASTYESANSTVQKLHNAWQMLDRPLILTTRELALAVHYLSDLLGLENFQVETIDRLRLCDRDENWHVTQPDDLAILILTSGSTGIPKGVMLTHQNILSNVAASAQINNFTSDDVSLNWLNLDHVGSLIRCSIRDIYVGSQQIHVPARAVLEDPLKWLDWIERYGVTFAWAPNFALGLVNARAEAIGQRQWDFSAVKSILSVAEAIVPKTARRFWELLAPHGLSVDAMHSAWGMSETCAAVTFSHRYLLSLPSDEYPFVEVGAPIPGFHLRIVDAENQVVDEDRIGQLQISGPMITCGYYQNPALNRETFTEDGWLKTGDLGYVHQGRLTITGRQKDVIIINGLNHYSHEIEAIAEAVEGVQISYTAACAVRNPESDTDRLVIFFHTPLNYDKQLVKSLKKAIRGNIVRELGINPAYIIPVEKDVIPKTAIGKIQRLKLKQEFEAGEFTEIVKQLDILNENANTLPDWFYRPIWQRKEAVTFNTQAKTGYFLVFLDQLGLGLRLCQKLQQMKVPCISVEVGSEFAQLECDRYSLDPQNPQHYQRLLESLKAGDRAIQQILHLWTYDEYRGEVSSLEALEQAQERGIYSLLFLVQALSQIQDSEKNIRLSVISSHTQPVSAADEIAYENSPILGMIKTIPQELPWLDCRHIDLATEGIETDATYILREIQVIQQEREVAYRNGQRLVSRLAKVDLIQEQKQEVPFQRGGMYLLSGGLGEIGIEIAKYLLQNYQARLLLLGRTPLPEKSTWEEHLRQNNAVSARIRAYQSLEQLGGEVIYAATDTCNYTELQQVVDRAKSRWKCQLDGVIHLAGIGQERLLVEETRESLSTTLRPKVLGTWVLHQLLQQQDNGVFINFSSVISFFGAFSVGGYAAANSFLDSFSHYQRAKSGLQSYCFGSSTWAGIGISRGYEARDARFAQGRQVMSVEQGLNSFLASLRHQPTRLLVGLDGSHPYVRRLMESTSHYTHSVQKLTAYFTAPDTQISVAKLQELEVCDRFGTRSTCNFRQIQEMRDRQQLAMGLQIPEYVAPRNQIEQQLTKIWQQVLNVLQVGIHNNFFELGGTSLLAVRLFSNIEQTFGKKLPLASLFPSGTVEALAQKISLTEEVLQKDITLGESRNSWSSLVEIQPKGSQPPLFCIHPLGGETLCYRNIALRLGSEQPVYALQPIGLDRRQPPHTRIEDMASHYIKEIKTIQPNGPYFLAGWSFGGFVVYEMAQQLHRQGEKVGLLGMIDTVRPGYFKRSPFLMRVLLHLKNFLQLGPAYLWQKAVGWSQQGKYHLEQRYKRYFHAKSYVSEVTQELSENDEHLEVIGANVQALDAYIFQSYPGRITLLRTEDENRCEAVGEQYDPEFGWGDIVQELDIHYIPGSHLSVMEEPHVGIVAAKLQVCLEKAYAITLTGRVAKTDNGLVKKPQTKYEWLENYG